MSAPVKPWEIFAAADMAARRINNPPKHRPNPDGTGIVALVLFLIPVIVCGIIGATTDGVGGFFAGALCIGIWPGAVLAGIFLAV